MNKGFSPVLGFVLVLFLSITMALSFATWLRASGRDMEEDFEETRENGKINFYISNVQHEDDDINITIKNNGRFHIPVDEIRGYYDGRFMEDMEHVEGPDPIPPGETAKFRIQL